MALFASIMVVSFLFGLSSSINKSDKFAGKVDEPVKFAAPAARSYKVLNWYSGGHILYSIAFAVWAFMFGHPWKRFTPQYIAQHHYHQTVQFLQTQDKILTSALLAVQVLFFAYILFSRNLKVITGILIVFVGFDVAHLVSDFNMPIYRVLIDIAVSAFTFLVLWSLLMKEKDFLKLVRSLMKHLKS